jgi:hypothetical protein
MDAPAAQHRAQSVAISWGVIGTWGLSALFGTIPVGARLMISLDVLMLISL